MVPPLYVGGNGASAGAGACRRKSSSISRTADSIPTKIARDTMLWPMFSSSISGSSATGRVF